MKIDKFEDIKSWQKAKTLKVKIHDLFKDCRDFGYRDQIRRCSVSIINNITEGFERRSNK